MIEWLRLKELSVCFDKLGAAPAGGGVVEGEGDGAGT